MCWPSFVLLSVTPHRCSAPRKPPRLQRHPACPAASREPREAGWLGTVHLKRLSPTGTVRQRRAGFMSAAAIEREWWICRTWRQRPRFAEGDPSPPDGWALGEHPSPAGCRGVSWLLPSFQQQAGCGLESCFVIPIWCESPHRSHPPNPTTFSPPGGLASLNSDSTTPLLRGGF